MVILHVVDASQVGGKQRVVEALAVGHHRLGHGIFVVLVMRKNGPTPDFVRPLREAGVGVEVLELPTRGYLRERTAVRNLCRLLRPDVLHTHGYRPDVVDAGVARRLGIPAVTTVHGFTGGGRNHVYEWLQRRAFRRFDAVVAVSWPLAEHLLRCGISRERVHVLRNAWMPTHGALDRETARQRLSVNSGFHVGWVGRISREKGLDTLLDALAHLQDLPLTVSVLGDGRERATLERRAAALGVSDRVVWHGAVPRADRLFAAFDVFVLSSRTEGTPIALFEAMAAGVPVVATEVGGVPDILTPTEALLVPAEQPHALADAIRSVHGGVEQAAARAVAARNRLLTHFRLEPWLAAHERIYRRLSGR